MSSSRRWTCLQLETCEPRQLLAADSQHMRVGMNLENIVDWSPAWTFTDAFQASRPWIAQAVNTATGEMVWDVGASHPLNLDANGTPTAFTEWKNAAGQTIRQMAGTLMFRELDGAYAGGVYHAEWDGTGTVTFGFDARMIASGQTSTGHHYADLQVTPGSGGIFLRIEATSPADPVRDIHVWMPDWQGQQFAGQRWQPGAAFSPFHPLYLQRLEPFDTIRFMALQETNTSDIRTWGDRRDALDVRQGSGLEGTPSEPIVNGMSVEHMVQLANDLDADPWFNMPHMADDDFVRNFAIYVRDHLEPGRKAYVEWSNEIWNFGWGFEGSQWVAEQARLPANAGLDHWQVAGHEAKRDLDIWTDVFVGQTDRLVRVAAGWAAVDWVTNRIVESMAGSFDAIAIAPYITPTDGQRSSYTAATTVDRVLADTRANVATSLQWTEKHEELARAWQSRLGRNIQLVAYEGGPHLDGRNSPYQSAFYAATNDSRMGDISREYLRGLDAAGMDLYVDFQFTGGAGAASWGDFAKLHRMDEPLTTAHRYTAVVAAADGSLWSNTPPTPPPTPLPPPPPTPPPPPPPPLPPRPVISIASAAVVEGNTGRRPLTFTLTLSVPSLQPVRVRWATANGTARAGTDYLAGGGSVVFAPGQTKRSISVLVLADRIREANEMFSVRLTTPVNASLTVGHTTALGTIRNDDGQVRASLASAFAMLGTPTSSSSLVPTRR